MSEFITIAQVGEIPEGRGKAFTVGDRRIAVFCVGETYYALNDRCPHMGASLATGDLRDGTVICDRHLWAFQLADGQCPDVAKLRAETFEVRIEGQEVQVRLPQLTPRPATPARRETLALHPYRPARTSLQ